VNLEDRKAGGLLNLDVGRAGDVLQDAGDGGGGLLHVAKAVAIDFHGDVGSDPGD